jgi:hypothetical protein
MSGAVGSFAVNLNGQLMFLSAESAAETGARDGDQSALFVS